VASTSLLGILTASSRSTLTLTFSQKLYRYLTTKSQKTLLYETLESARVYEEWDAAAYQLDDLLGNQFWRQNPASGDYDHNLIYSRTQQTYDALEQDDIYALVHLLRSGLVRNLGNIATPKLYNRAYAGTKLLIEDYVSQSALAIEYVTAYPTLPGSELSDQHKLDILHDARLAFGRSCLVLQGGSIFGLCHIGVVKALHLRGLLPRIIVGTATGALMAALVGVHTEEELLAFLSGEGIDLSAFAAASERAADAAQMLDHTHSMHGWLPTLLRRMRRFLKYGYVLDVNVLEECAKANTGDLTFEEAYQRTKRVLNITISFAGGGVPSLLNYLTAPNVLIWSAAMASNASDARVSPVTLQCKMPNGNIEPWDLPMHASSVPSKPIKRKTPSTDHDRNTPLSRVAELFNVNHFIVSQARPYIAPFLAPSLHHSNSRRSSKEPWATFFTRLIAMELHHRLSQMDQLGLLSPGVRRLLLDETVPGASWTLVPQVSLTDFARLLRNPTREEVDYWILRGERSVWPAVTALQIRCIVEVELDRGYQIVRRRKPFDADLIPAGDGPKIAREGRKRRKLRAASMGAA
jgi:TAG lipase / lysophosphatidylethanolamine acyltransferase